MASLSDRSVHLIITSPPYWQLKDYGHEEQLGYHDDYESYINQLNAVWQECGRVLHPGCRLCINIGDQFARAVIYGRYKVIPIRTEIIRFCESIGMDYMGAVIWQKVTTTNTTGGATIMGSYPFPRNGILKLDYEFILLFKKHGTAPRPTADQKEKSRMTKAEWNTYFAGHWNFPGTRQISHIAAFPEELPHRLIKMFSFAGERVLDPFCGSGTTLLAAAKLGRTGIGYEINEAYISVAKDRLEKAGIPIILKEETTSPEWEKIQKNLPYTFSDPLALDKKRDPKKHHFGSQIDNHKNSVENFFKVSGVKGPDSLLLHDGRTIRLIGVKVKEGKIQAATKFLRDKCQGQNIYLKKDPQIADTGQIAWRYIYLKNRTFINAHLIKRGLAAVDESRTFKYKVRFLNYYQKSKGGN